MLTRVLGWILVALAASVAVVLVWPQAFGLQDQWIAAHVVALRGAAALIAIGGAVVFGLIALQRRGRRLAIALAVVLALFAVGNVAVLAARGFGTSAAGVAAAAADGDLTVLAWNTLGEVPDAEVIADLALREEADVVVLPETTAEYGDAIALTMRDGGRPMWVHSLAYDEISKARSTTMLISPDLGEYRVVSTAWPGPPDNTNTLPTVVAEPVDGDGPLIVAVHAVAPIRWELRNWRSDLDWLAALCDGGSIVMAGDFNATLDHFAGRGVDGGDLGTCRDAAAATGAAAVGTWPTAVPALLGSPIDHVLTTSDWRVASFRVVGEADDAGSDHRPVVARLVHEPSGP